jgi:hypothetical protein
METNPSQIFLYLERLRIKTAVSFTMTSRVTGSFPFMFLDGSICFLVMYHYKSNCILVSPIVGLDDKSVFTAYEKRFKELESKGFKPKFNVMDNQAMKHMKQFLTKNECSLQLVEPHNHRVNAA